MSQFVTLPVLNGNNEEHWVINVNHIVRVIPGSGALGWCTVVLSDQYRAQVDMTFERVERLLKKRHP